MVVNVVVHGGFSVVGCGGWLSTVVEWLGLVVELVEVLLEVKSGGRWWSMVGVVGGLWWQESWQGVVGGGRRKWQISGKRLILLLFCTPAEKRCPRQRFRLKIRRCLRQRFRYKEVCT